MTKKSLLTSWSRTSTSGIKIQAQRTTFHSDRDFTDKKKEEKEMGVGAYITDCLLTKPSRLLAPPVRLLFIIIYFIDLL